MASFLNNLLMGLQGAIDPIEVVGKRQRSVDQEAPPALGNRQWIEELIDVQGKAPERKGMFGLKGTLRDIIGTVGDAFLINEGADPIYSKRRQQERESDALAGFTDNPLAAAERLAAAGNHKLAADIMDNVSRTQVASASAGQTETKNKIDRITKGAGLFGQFYGASSPETYGKVRPLLDYIKREYGLGDEFFVSEGYDPKLAETFQRGGMPATAQVRDDRTLEAERGRNKRAAESNQVRRETDNPAPRPTASNVDAEVLEKVRTGTATPEEKRYFEQRLRKGKPKLDLSKLPPSPFGKPKPIQ